LHELVVLGLQPVELGREAGAAAERLAGEVFTVLGERLACLVLELAGGLLELLGLQFDALAVATSATPRLTCCSCSSCFS
jgi:hypothetical protein